MSELIEPADRVLTVLHVDDDPMNLRVVEEILGAFGHRAVRAQSGDEALEQLSRQAFDVVLMDVHMPQMSGIETLQKLRACPGPERDTPVIALTADTLSRTPAEYRALGFTDYMSKPIMVMSLRDLLRRVAGPATPRMSRAG